MSGAAETHRRCTRPRSSFRTPRVSQSETHSRARARARARTRRQASPREPGTSKITSRRHSVTLCPNRRSLIAKPSRAEWRGAAEKFGGFASASPRRILEIVDERAREGGRTMEFRAICIPRVVTWHADGRKCDGLRRSRGVRTKKESAAN